MKAATKKETARPLEMVFVVDSREQRPYSLRGVEEGMIEQVEDKLKVGDYSVQGYEDLMAYERKSHDDLFACLTSKRKHFVSQLVRLAEIPHRGLLIDATVAAVLLGHLFCKLDGIEALRRLFRETTSRAIPVYFCDSHGGDVASILLHEAWKQEVKRAGRK